MQGYHANNLPSESVAKQIISDYYHLRLVKLLPNNIIIHEDQESSNYVSDTKVAADISSDMIDTMSNIDTNNMKTNVRLRLKKDNNDADENVRIDFYTLRLLNIKSSDVHITMDNGDIVNQNMIKDEIRDDESVNVLFKLIHETI